MEDELVVQQLRRPSTWCLHLYKQKALALAAVELLVILMNAAALSCNLKQCETVQVVYLLSIPDHYRRVPCAW